MKFCDKLNFLLDITKTPNSVLAHAAALDASYISRLRSGSRPIPRSEEIVLRMAAFFSRNCAEEYRQKAIADAMGLPVLPADMDERTQTIFHWLLRETDSGSRRMTRFINGLNALPTSPLPASSLPKADIPVYSGPVQLFYGVEGKRQAVLRLMHKVALRDKPQTLLLFSDEEMSWMTGDPNYSRQLTLLMFEVLSKGNRIHIVHSIQRNLDEMLNAIGSWMPLYMTGQIEPYFYPKKRDGVFQRTLFVAPETAAVISASTGEKTESSVNMMIHEKQAIDVYTDEFLQFFHLCRPLMKVYTARSRNAYFSMIAEFEDGDADALIKTESLSLLTMPEPLFHRIVSRSGIHSGDLAAAHRERRRRFERSLSARSFTEIISLPDPTEVNEGKVKVALSDFLEGGSVFYTPEEYSLHLSAIIKRLENDQNFHLHIIRRSEENRYMVYVREEWGAVVAKTSQPPVALSMNEGNITAAFWDFLMDMIGRSAYETADNRRAAGFLRGYLRAMEEPKAVRG